MTNQVTFLNTQVTSSELLNLATEIVSSYVSHNTVEASELTNLIQEVYATLTGLSSGRGVAAQRPDPAVAIKKSIFPDYIVCLEDGKKLKMLKRHLMSAYNMTPEQYRERWGLSADYPMVAPNYAERRSQLAKNIGLGTRAKKGGRKAADNLVAVA
jgi:predicted transcriptional regulator